MTTPDLPYVGLEHLDSGSVELSRWGTANEVTSLKSHFFERDILYGKLRPYLDKGALAPFEGFCSSDILVLSARKEVLPEFVAHTIHTERFLSWAVSTTAGLNHPRTSWASIADFTLSLPSLTEQREIVRVLTTVREAIRATDKVIVSSRALMGSLMSEFFDDSAWPHKSLGAASDLSMGQSPPSCYYNEAGNGLPFLQGKAEFSDKYPRATKYCTVSPKVASIGSVLMSVRAPVGDVNVADREYVIGRGVAALKARTGNSEYLYYVLKHFKSRVEALGTGTTFASVNKGTLERFEIPVPDHTEQDRTATALGALDTKLTTEQDRLRALYGLYHSLLERLMSGQQRLPILEVAAGA